MTDVTEFQHLFAHLRSDTNRIRYPSDTLHRAPHKPLLLLSVLDLAAERGIPDGRIEVSTDLGELFSHYWHRVMPPAQRPNLALPFFHLQRDGGFWTLIATPGNERTLASIPQITSMSQLRSLVAYAVLTPTLTGCIADARTRTELRALLLRTYFSPAAQERLLEQSTVNVESFEYSLRLLNQREVADMPEQGEYSRAARNQGFRRAIVTAYDYRCAMCGIRVVTFDGHVAVDAAHIRPWSQWHDDNPSNGLALCRLCHWSFDEGLLSATRHRVILVSPQLTSSGNISGHLVQLAERPLIIPPQGQSAPDPEALVWHRQHVFQAH